MAPKYKKIMLIDDNEIDNYIIKALLKNNNIAQEIVQFDNGLKAIEYLQTNKDIFENLPEIILLDIYMPIMDGFQFMDELQKIESIFIKNCKICVVSSSIDNNDIQRTMVDKNVFTYVTKPISAEFLLSL